MVLKREIRYPAAKIIPSILDMDHLLQKREILVYLAWLKSREPSAAQHVAQVQTAARAFDSGGVRIITCC